MAHFNSQIINNFIQLIKEADSENPYQPTFAEIKKWLLAHFPNHQEFPDLHKEKLARELVARARRRLKKEGLYFYATNGRFKLLMSSQDRLNVTGKLWDVTKGFAGSTHSLLADTMQSYPRLSKTFWLRIQARLDTVIDLAKQITTDVETAIQKYEGGDNERANR